MNPYLIFILSFLLLDFFLELTTELLNLRHLSKEVPQLFVSHLEPEEYQRSQNYLKDNTTFELVHSTVMLIILFILILSGTFNLIDVWARSFHFNSIATGLLFAAALFFGFQLLNFPFSLYQTFVIEEKYEFNQTTLKTFVADRLKGILLVLLIGGITLVPLLWLFEKAGSQAWLYCWGVFVSCQLFLTYITPTWLMPLFNKFTPLKDEKLKHAIETYAKGQNFAIEGVFVMDSSKRSTKSNAFFTGIGKSRRVVLFDSLLEKYTPEEIVAIVAHEVGHYKRKHIFKFLALSVLHTGLVLYIFSWFLNNPTLFEAFQMQHLSVYASLLFFGFLYFPITTFLSIILNAVSRKFEYQADAFAVATCAEPQALTSALKKLAVDNLSNLTPHPWKVAITYSHPPILDRLSTISLRWISSCIPRSDQF